MPELTLQRGGRDRAECERDVGECKEGGSGTEGGVGESESKGVGDPILMVGQKNGGGREQEQEEAVVAKASKQEEDG
jgi:hypothetical protein